MLQQLWLKGCVSSLRLGGEGGGVARSHQLVTAWRRWLRNIPNEKVAVSGARGKQIRAADIEFQTLDWTDVRPQRG